MDLRNIVQVILGHLLQSPGTQLAPPVHLVKDFQTQGILKAMHCPDGGDLCMAPIDWDDLGQAALPLWVSSSVQGKSDWGRMTGLSDVFPGNL